MKRWLRPSLLALLACLVVAAVFAVRLDSPDLTEITGRIDPPWTFQWLATSAVLTAGALCVTAVRPGVGTAVLYGLAMTDAMLAFGWQTPYTSQPAVVVVIGLYVVLRSPSRCRWPWLLATAVLSVAHSLAYWPDRGLEAMAFGLQMVVAFGVAAIVAEVTKRRFLLVELLRQRTRELDRLRVLEAEAAAAAERSRLARTTHDVLADAVMAMVVQAGGGRRAVRSRPRDAVDAFAAVEEAGRHALDTLRRALSAARADDLPGNDAAELVHATNSADATTDPTDGPKLRRVPAPDYLTVLTWTVVAAATTVTLLPYEVPDGMDEPALSTVLQSMVWTMVAAALVALLAVRPVAATVALYAMTIGQPAAWYVGLNTPFSFLFPVGAAIGLYVMLRSPARRRWPWLVATGALVLGHASLQFSWHDARQEVLNLGGWFVLAVVLAEVARRRLQLVDVLRQRASDLERANVLQAQTAVSAERMRVARELHDVIAHTVMAMVVQAGAGRRAVERRPHDAEAAFAVVESIGRQARGELRHVMGVVRATGDGRTQRPASLVDLDTLVAGSPVPVRLAVSGTPVVLDPVVDLAAYRVVQEALTNISKHAAGTAEAVVEVRWRAGSLEIEVSDDGAPGTAACVQRSGYGLLGMSERVEQCGGSLAAGPRFDAPGWRVRAMLPHAPARAA